MNALSGTLLLLLLVAVCLAPRRWALLAMMGGVFFLTQGHSIDVAGLNIFPIRFLEAAACGRVLLRRELVWSRTNRIDWTLLLLYNYTAAVWILRSSEVTAQQYASALDPTLCYLALRGLIRDVGDVAWFLKRFAVLLVPFTALVCIERLTGESAFAIVGAETELLFRNEWARCQGSFRHAILLGSVAASFMSLYIGLWAARDGRALAVVGGGACLALVFLSNSGGPLTSTAAAFLGWCAWTVRHRMSLVRRATVGSVLLLMVFMKAPIWYLPYKISGIVGGSGYHRGVLMEQAWHDLGKWWLTGMDIKDTASWIPYVHDLFGGADVTNQFLTFGIRAGLPALGLCILVLWLAFRDLGDTLAAVRASCDRKAEELLLWGLGTALAVHVVSWWGVAYFDQSYVVWLMHLAAVTAAVPVAVSQSREAPGTALRPTTAWSGRHIVPSTAAHVSAAAMDGDRPVFRESASSFPRTAWRATIDRMTDRRAARSLPMQARRSRREP